MQGVGLMDSTLIYCEVDPFDCVRTVYEVQFSLIRIHTCEAFGIGQAVLFPGFFQADRCFGRYAQYPAGCFFPMPEIEQKFAVADFRHRGLVGTVNIFRKEACLPAFSVVFTVYAACLGRRMAFDSAGRFLIPANLSVRQPDGHYQFSCAGGNSVPGTGSAHIPFIWKASVCVGNLNRLAETDSVIVAVAMPYLLIIPVENQMDSVPVHNQYRIVPGYLTHCGSSGQLMGINRIAEGLSAVRAAADGNPHIRPVIPMGASGLIYQQNRPFPGHHDTGDSVFVINAHTQFFNDFLFFYLQSTSPIPSNMRFSSSLSGRKGALQMPQSIPFFPRRYFSAAMIFFTLSISLMRLLALC